MTIKKYHVGFILALSVFLLMSHLAGTPDTLVGIALPVYILTVAIVSVIKRIVS